MLKKVTNGELTKGQISAITKDILNPKTDQENLELKKQRAAAVKGKNETNNNN